MARSSMYLLGAVGAFALALGAVFIGLPQGGVPGMHADPDEPPGAGCPPPGRVEVPASLQVTYARGWDGGVVQPLEPADARARDAAGEPYVAILHDGVRPSVLVRTAWAEHRLEVLLFDDEGRTVLQLDLRAGSDSDVFLREHRAWSFSAGATPQTAERRTVTWFPEGACSDVHEPEGDAGSLSHRTHKAERLRADRPEPGRWDGVLELAGVGSVHVTKAGDDALPRSDGEPWSPVGPLAPGDLDAMFEPGTQVRTSLGDARIEVREAGRVRFTSGRVVVTDPSYLPEVGAPLVAEVPPGTYPVDIAIAAEAEGSTVAGARLTVTDHEVESWEMGLRAGEDVIELGDGEFYGFGVDAGTASFVDADLVSGLTDAALEAPALLEDSSAQVGDDDMVLWHSGYGDGYYPVWVGRDADGEVAAFVADMLVLAEG